LVRWKLAPTTQAVARLKYFVDRGESPTALKPISTALPYNGLFEFVDLTAGLIDVYRLYYYRIRAVEYDGGNPVQTFESDVVTWDGEQDLVGLYIVQEHDFAFRYVMGVPTLIFKRKRDGMYCPECFDTVLRRVTKSNCKTCFGTGKEGGFYAPIESWLNVMEGPQKNPAMGERGDAQNPKTMIQLTNYPIVDEGDIIVEMQQDRYWKIQSLSASEKHRYPVLQLCNVSEVGRNDVEQFIHVDETQRRRLVDLLIAQRKELEF
jgi:hypothetical protein